MNWLGAPKIGRSLALNVVFDGNSLVAGDGASSGKTMPDQALALIRTSFTDVTGANLGIGGQTWRQMDGVDGGSASDVDGAWSPTRTNILVLWETTNAIYAGRTAAQAAGDAQSYLAHRLAARPGWRILLLSTLPRQFGVGGTSGQSDIDALNASLVQADQIFRDNVRAWGGKMFVDVRAPGSPFRYADYAASTFARDTPLWKESPGTRTHLSDAGYAIVAGLVARAVLNLTAI